MLEKVIALIIILSFLYFIYKNIKRIKKTNLEENPCASCSRDCNLKK